MSEDSPAGAPILTGPSQFLTRPGKFPLVYFEDVVAAEFKSINLRRDDHERAHLAPLKAPDSPGAPYGSPEAMRPMATAAPKRPPTSRQLSPNPAKLFPKMTPSVDAVSTTHSSDLVGLAAATMDATSRESRVQEREPEVELPQPPLDPRAPDYDKTRPQPVPCTATGLAFSGGGIRSAAVCLGALQALHARKIVPSIDYLSTVSGGGYIGACLSAAMSEDPSAAMNEDRRGAFPFGDDVMDSSAVAHLRNYSNYLMPRGRSSLQNFADATAIILRGLIANVVIVLAVVLLCVLVTLFGAHHNLGSRLRWLVVYLAAGAAAVLFVWAILRSRLWFDKFTDDTDSRALRLARALVVLTILAAIIALQPLAIGFVAGMHDYFGKDPLSQIHLGAVTAALGSLGAVVSVCSGALGSFLRNTENAKNWTTLILRWATQALIFLVALIVPAAIWLAYLEMSRWGIEALTPDGTTVFLGLRSEEIVPFYLPAFCFAAVALFVLQPNGYSLHRFYRDRLSKAFLFVPPKTGMSVSKPLDALKLSNLRLNAGPYHIVNSALNVQGSKEANRRGRNADFFMFTRHVVGSDLTHYVRVADMEPHDERLDLATAMAISGAAVSANMGNSTIRLLSPTLALLNVQLGYWLINPLYLATTTQGWTTIWRGANWLLSHFSLLGEMFNLIDETSRYLLLTDGGHIENLGIYELLKRGCQLIVVVDAEADPSLSFPSLLALERYARIDLGVRINLPWEEIAATYQLVDKPKNDERVRFSGPHCAIGRIIYQTKAQGILVYIKSSVTGDEKDYILDYKKRNSAFPHETTGDQFFTEEQFEVYRALGYHMVDGLFSTDNFSFLSTGEGSFADRDAVVSEVREMLGRDARVWDGS
jgi:hypothetical protein